MTTTPSGSAAKRRLPRNVRRTIDFALRRADRELRKGCSVPREHQEAMRLYLDTWVAGPLREVLLWDEGSSSAFLDWNDGGEREVLESSEPADEVSCASAAGEDAWSRLLVELDDLSDGAKYQTCARIADAIRNLIRVIAKEEAVNDGE